MIRSMLTALVLSALVLIASAQGFAAGEPLRLSEPVEVGDGYEVFGSPMTDKSPAPSLSAVLAQAREQDGDLDKQSIRLSCSVKQVCQKKGCFFIAADGADWARVTFVDYSFFVPTDSAGKEVILEGTLTEHTLSQQQADHYQADLGAQDAAPATALKEYSIVATSVLMPTQ